MCAVVCVRVCVHGCVYVLVCVHKRDRAVSAELVMETWGESHLPFAHTNSDDATRIISSPCHHVHMNDECDGEDGSHTVMDHLGSSRRQTHTCAHTRHDVNANLNKAWNSAC